MGFVPDSLTQFIGGLIVLAAFIDIYLTVLQRGNVSLIGKHYIRLIWNIFRQLASIAPRYQDKILSYAGPTLIPAIIYLWASLLSVGFALIFLPEMGTGVVAASGPTPTGFWPALYFSLMSLVTLGAGDFIATTNLLRLIDTFGALAGFTVLTASLSYLMSIYSSLTKDNSFALALQYATGDKGTSIGLLTKLGAGGDFSASQSTMGSLATEMLSLIEAHHTYTVLHYFRPRRTAYARPRIAFVMLDSASLIRTALDQEHYHSLVQSASVAQFWGGGMQMVKNLGQTIVPAHLVQDHLHANAHEKEWRDHFARALEQLQAEGIQLTDSPETGCDRYVEIRKQWQPYLSAFSEYLMYQKDVVQSGDNQ